MNHLSAETQSRKSLLKDIHQSAGARYRDWQDQAIVSHYEGGLETEHERVQTLALCDLSTIDRCGFKGPETSDWLEYSGIALPGRPNHAVLNYDGCLVARLSYEEHLILRNPFGEQERPAIFSAGVETGRRVYSLPRQESHAWLFLSGSEAATMMSYLCAVDLRSEQFANLTVAQTSVAKLNSLVIRHDVGNVPGFHLLCDQPSVAYWWEVLLDAMVELGGGPVGIESLLALKRAMNDV